MEGSDGRTATEKIIEDADWELIGLKLLVYTYRRTTGMYWRRVQNGPIPGGLDLTDFVQEAILNFLNNPEKFDPRKQTLLRHLKGKISSRVNHVSHYLENEKEQRFKIPDEETERFTMEITNVEDRSILAKPDSSLLQTEERQAILAELEPGTSEWKIVRAVIDEDLETPREIAAHLGIDVRDVNNAKKRLKRTFKNFMGGIPKVNEESPLSDVEFELL